MTPPASYWGKGGLVPRDQATRKLWEFSVELKNCARCSTPKSVSEFSRQARRPDGLHPWCKTCCLEYNREWIKRPGVRQKRLDWRRENEAYDRSRRVEYLYGVSAATYESLLVQQDGRCAVCGADSPGGRWNTWHVDHDHDHCPGKRGCAECVRGLLCNGCNVAIGHFRDSPGLLRAAADYIEERARARSEEGYAEDRC